MGFRCALKNEKGQLVGGWARVWKVDVKENRSIVQLSVSKKNSEGIYETEFQANFVSFVGKAHEMIKNIVVPEKGGVGIQILNCDVTNKYVEAQKKEYVNYAVFDFEFTDNNVNTTRTQAEKKDDFMDVPDGVDEELPFN